MDHSSSEALANRVVAKIQSIHENGTDYLDHNRAFDDACKIIEELAAGAKKSEIDLRFVGVALCYSLPFLEKRLVPFIRSHPTVQFIIRVAFVDPDYLATFDLDTQKFNWSEFSQKLPLKLEALSRMLTDEGLKNFAIDVATFEGIPQRHGLLINGASLFLGITDWDWNAKSKKPRLTVGSNYYRFYDLSTTAGKAHIDQFRHWFTFYQRHGDFKKVTAEA